MKILDGIAKADPFLLCFTALNYSKNTSLSVFNNLFISDEKVLFNENEKSLRKYLNSFNLQSTNTTVNLKIHTELI